MNIQPRYTSIGSLFRDEYVFNIPKYQRDYAWTDEEVEDFVRDLKNCYIVRSNGQSMHHFFGGVVSVESSVPGSARKQHDLIDGQQRLSTFVMLVACVTSVYKSLRTTLGESDKDNDKLLNQRIRELTRKYIEYEDEINREIRVVDRLTMAKADKVFFRNLIRGHPQTEKSGDSYKRESHRRLDKAYGTLEKFVLESIDSLKKVSDKLDSLKRFEEILNDDFTVIHIVTTTKSEAYRLFQVLNDRGMGLTEGDLLKSRTLEMLESNEFLSQQDTVERAWEDILADHPDQTEKFLRWYYSSIIGKRPGRSTLLDEFIDEFFPSGRDPSDVVVQTIGEAKNVADRVCHLSDEITVLRKLIEGSWPYETASSEWYKERLRLLVIELHHTNCLPLLLAAARHLDHHQFADLVDLTERFVFRYKTTCNQHISPLTSVYLAHAVKIRKSPKKYQPKEFAKDLRPLEKVRASDEVFVSNLNQLQYNKRRSNKPLKYMLITLEHYARWYYEGVKGRPKCKDKTRIFDFAKTTIEHVYPQQARVRDDELEELVNTLGNLTFLGPDDNNTGGNSPFEEKKSVFRDSSVLLNRKIADKDKWSVDRVRERQEELMDMALKIFSMGG
jgi:hypothetical protein